MTKVKICGLTTTHHVNDAISSGADFIGFVFAKSKRQITPQEVLRITKNCPKTVKKVGVFVSPTLTDLDSAIEVAKLDCIQLHGKQLDEVNKALQSNHFKDRGIDYIHVLSGNEDHLMEKLTTSQADYILLDAPSEKEVYAGGNGKTFDWEETASILKKIPTKKIIIAGGLTIDNVKKACDLFKPYAVDVSSGVETNEKKDSDKIKQFITNVKEK